MVASGGFADSVALNAIAMFKRKLAETSHPSLQTTKLIDDICSPLLAFQSITAIWAL